MCFDISYALKKEDIELRFDTRFKEPDVYEPVYHVSAFSLPKAPVITNEEERTMKMLNWGLIPFWVKDRKTAEDIRLKTFNARSETIFEKGKNYPYYIKAAEGGAFALAGIWDTWKNKETDEELFTFSIITTKANPLLEKIHNKKKRMPAILRKEDEFRWLETDLSKEDVYSILIPVDDSALDAHTVSKLVSNRRTRNTNVAEVLVPHEYDELRSEQTKLF
jgi:putative SOS response-associated peptidase YedK